MINLKDVLIEMKKRGKVWDYLEIERGEDCILMEMTIFCQIN